MIKLEISENCTPGSVPNQPRVCIIFFMDILWPLERKKSVAKAGDQENLLSGVWVYLGSEATTTKKRFQLSPYPFLFWNPTANNGPRAAGHKQILIDSGEEEKTKTQWSVFVKG